MPRNPLPDGIMPRGLNMEQAAAYVGVGTTLFAQMVSDGRMPKPKQASAGRVVWDVRALDRAFERLPTQGATAEDGPPMRL